MHLLMHWEHDHNMFPLHPLFTEAGRRHQIEVELMAGGNLSATDFTPKVGLT